MGREKEKRSCAFQVLEGTNCMASIFKIKMSSLCLEFVTAHRRILDKCRSGAFRKLTPDVLDRYAVFLLLLTGE